MTNEELIALADPALVMLVRKMVEGKPYRIYTDNPDTLRRARSIAGGLGGSLAELKEGNDYVLTFEPPPRC
jgi:hypothetical protein